MRSVPTGAIAYAVWADRMDTILGARVRVVIDVANTPCHVRADVSQFETALINMAVNARNAMDGERVLTLAITCHTAVAKAALIRNSGEITVISTGDEVLAGHAFAIGPAQTEVGLAVDRVVEWACEAVLGSPFSRYLGATPGRTAKINARSPAATPSER